MITKTGTEEDSRHFIRMALYALDTDNIQKNFPVLQGLGWVAANMVF